MCSQIFWTMTGSKWNGNTHVGYWREKQYRLHSQSIYKYVICSNIQKYILLKWLELLGKSNLLILNDNI